nr:hypothetical protein [Tanacetum cinerariifolium]
MNSLPPQEQQISVMKSQIFNNGLMNRFMRHGIDTKDLLRAYPHHGFTEFHQLETFYNALNLADQDSLNAAACGNLLERRTQDVLTIIENKSKVHNSRNKSVVSQVKSYYANSNSSSKIAKLTHAVNQQSSVVTTVMTAILKQFQATPPTASVKAVEEICITCAGAHPYYQCLAIGGNTFPEHRDNTQGHVSAAVVNYHQGSGSLPRNTVANPKGKLKAITTRSGIVLDGPTVPTPPPFIYPEEDKRVEETLTDPDLSKNTIKVPPPPLHINITLADALILMPKYQKMLNALLSNKEKLQELANTPLNENFSAVILKKLPEKFGDPAKFLIPCGFSELKCKALDDLGASINLMPLSVWKKLAVILKKLPEKFGDPAKFLIPCGFSELKCKALDDLGASINLMPLSVWKKLEMILRDGDERLTLNMRHDTSSYTNQPQKESINLINVFNNSSKDFLKDLFSPNQPSGNPTFSSHPELTLPEVKDDIFDPEGGNVLPKKLLDLDFTKDLHPPLHDNPLSGSTTYSSSPNPLLEELTDELALITFPPKYDDNLQFDVDNLADNFVDSMPEMFTEEHAPDYSSPLVFDEYDDDLLEVESDTEKFYDDPFDSKGEKIKESKLLIDELDIPCDLLPPSEYDSFISQDFSRVDALPSTNNEDKLATSNASLVLEDFDPPLYEPLFFKKVPSIPRNLKTLAKGFCPPIFISSASLGNHVSKSNRANVYLLAYLINGLRFT